MHIRQFGGALAIALLPVVALAQGAPLDVAAVQQDQLTWTTNANGSTQAVVLGDPTKPGPYVIHVKFPAGLKLDPHFHPDDRIGTILSGTLHFGIGEQFDESKLTAVSVHGVWTEPARRAHFAWAKDAATIQVIGHGPTSATPVRK